MLASRGRDHGRGQKNAGETISFTLLTLTKFFVCCSVYTGNVLGALALQGAVRTAPMKNDESCHNYAKGC